MYTRIWPPIRRATKCCKQEPPGQKGPRVALSGHLKSVRSAEASSAFGRNPFAGKSAAEVDELLRARGFRAVGPDSAAGRGSYFHPTTGRKYYLDPGGKYRAGTELPHVDVHRMQDGLNLEGVKKKLPLGESLYE